MARVRRTIHRLPPRRDFFDEHQWPINITLLVLAGFLVGAAVAVQRFDDPRWQYNAWTTIIGAPLAVLTMWALLHWVGYRFVRRTMQLGLVVSLLAHLLFILGALQVRLFHRASELRVAAERQPRREVVLPEYHRWPDRDRQQQEFERPVETPDPQPVADQPAPRPAVTPPTAQRSQDSPSTPEEAEPTPQVNLQRRESDLANPSSSPAEARLSRQASTTDQPRPAQPQQSELAAAEAAPSGPPTHQPTKLTPQRQASPTTAQPAAASPAAADAPRVAQNTRAEPQDGPQLAAPALPRRVARPEATPRADSTNDLLPGVARRSEQPALQPANTAAVQKLTTSPREVERAAPEAAAPLERQQLERQAPAPDQPEIAQTSQPTPDRRQRLTDRPASTQTVDSPAATEFQVASEALTPQPTAAQVSQAAPSASRPAVTDPQPPSESSAHSQLARRAATSTTPATPMRVAEIARHAQTSEPALAQAANPQAVTPGTSNPLAALAPATSATVRRQQAPGSTSATRSLGEPSTSAAGRPDVQLAARSPEDATENPRGQASPTPQRSAVLAQAVAAQASPAASSSASTEAATADGALRPNAGQIARQPSASNVEGARLDSSAAASDPAGSTTSLQATRASATPQPVTSTASNPGRSTLATLPGAASSSEQPRMELTESTATGDTSRPDLVAAALALNRGQLGRAGAASSTNLASDAPAGEAPAPSPSSAARREAAQQNTEAGPALAPASPAPLARGLAMSPAPASNWRAEDMPSELAGAANPTPSMLASSAADQVRRANAAPADAAAAAGQLEIDTGATQIVRADGMGRAGGGGQPELNPESQGALAAGRSALAGVQAPLTAQQPAAQASAAGGGQPQPALAANTADAERQEAAAGGGQAPGEPNQLAGGPLAEAVAGAPAAQRASGAEGEVDAATASLGEPDEEELERRRQQALRLARSDLGAGIPEARSVPSPEFASAPPAAGQPAASLAAETGDLDRPGQPRAAESPSAAPAGVSPEASAATAGGIVSARAEASDGATGLPRAGGGSQSVQRQAARPLFAANTPSEFLEAAGQPQSAGQQRGNPLAAQGATLQRSASGLNRANTLEPGAIGAEEPAVELTAQAGARRQTGAQQPQGVVANLENASPGRRATQRQVDALAQVTSPSQLPEPQEGDGDALAALAELPNELVRQEVGAVGGGSPLLIPAPDGPGGLAQSARERGEAVRRNRLQPADPVLNPQRFLRQNLGGRPDAANAVVIAAEPFQRRVAQRQGDSQGGGRGRPGPQTERAIELGLAFLARHQLNDGSWSLRGFDPEPIVINSDAAATALSLLAFQGAGYHHKDFRYAANVQAGLDYLLHHQDVEGAVFADADPSSNLYVKLYTHALASIALCEAYGMTQDPDLREPAQRAIDYIVQSQDIQLGGWRYQPGQDSDTSVTGWMTMALKSGELAQLKVPQDCFARIERWLDAAQASPQEPHLFRYNPNAPDNPRELLGRTPSKTMSSVGLLMRMYLGWRRDSDKLKRGADYLMQHLPQMGVAREEPYLKNRDTYYWYYATQVMFHMGGEYWQRWNEALHTLLLQSQIQDGALAGSWDPRRPVPDRWGPRVGRLYVTTMNLLSLEVYYRHLPLYEDTAK